MNTYNSIRSFLVTNTRNRNRWILVAASVVLLASFYGFSKWIRTGGMGKMDFDTTVKVQDRMPKQLDGVWEDLAILVEPMPSMVVLGTLTLLALVDFRKKKIRLRALLIPLLFGLLVAAELYGKSVVTHPAPPFFMIKNPTTIFPKHYINEQFSYPSGHVARAVFLGITSYSLFMIHDSLFKRKKLHVLVAGGIICYILMIAISRIYLGHHWLSDVIGGGLLGSALGAAVISGFLKTKTE